MLTPTPVAPTLNSIHSSLSYRIYINVSTAEHIDTVILTIAAKFSMQGYSTSGSNMIQNSQMIQRKLS